MAVKMERESCSGKVIQLSGFSRSLTFCYNNDDNINNNNNN